MKRYKDIKVSTTENISGIKILQHIKPISAHTVLGTNVFSDFLGGITDLIGGKSESYQKRLKSIYNDAISEIKQSCYEVGGNCVIGLKVDIDEISGKGKSMFMITAIGTAVLGESITAEKKVIKKQDGKIYPEDIEFLENRLMLLEMLEDKSLKLTDNNWKFIIDNKIVEVIPFLLDRLEKRFAYSEENLKVYLEQLYDYFSLLDAEISTSYLYDYIEQTNFKTGLNIVEIIKKLYLLDYDKTIKIIESSKLDAQKIGLHLSTLEKSYYTIDDIEKIENLISKIDVSFIERIQIQTTTVKQFLKSIEKEVWICGECQKPNEMDLAKCHYCKKDKYGFARADLTPKKVKDYLNKKILLIKELANSKNIKSI
ncbi:YbjQ family protein [Polaribacter litorisediminis]|uniref:YbjQ family protein n=1 Tax=Polaribacter litorisediminis TaxID=1908341 RepID=UPI001CBE396F|nr:YbjQ family protein [Polaribacter litorisediminis]UAM97773.1 YbjQ family protein [Polaribacter litorisediminis]